MIQYLTIDDNFIYAIAGIAIGFVFHLIGDYLFQNDYLANEKTKRFKPAFIHAIIYSSPFFLIVGWKAVFIIFATHLMIDRFRLAIEWIRFVNVRYYPDEPMGFYDIKGKGFVFNNKSNFGFDENKPNWMSVWLMIIIDNSWHVVINSFAIFFYYKGNDILTLLGL